jgi:hypothetical protein
MEKVEYEQPKITKKYMVVWLVVKVTSDFLLLAYAGISALVWVVYERLLVLNIRKQELSYGEILFLSKVS